MINLRDIRDYFQAKQLATAEQVSQAFDINVDLVEHMLMFFVKRRDLVMIDQTSCEVSGSCSTCEVGCDRPPLYCWRKRNG